MATKRVINNLPGPNDKIVKIEGSTTWLNYSVIEIAESEGWEVVGYDNYNSLGTPSKVELRRVWVAVEEE
jgi:hypothetical protein